MLSLLKLRFTGGRGSSGIWGFVAASPQLHPHSSPCHVEAHPHPRKGTAPPPAAHVQLLLTWGRAQWERSPRDPAWLFLSLSFVPGAARKTIPTSRRLRPQLCCLFHMPSPLWGCSSVPTAMKLPRPYTSHCPDSAEEAFGPRFLRAHPPVAV